MKGLKILLAISAIFISTSTSFAATNISSRTDSLLRLLDTAVANKAMYAAKRSARILELDKQIEMATTNEDAFRLLEEQYEVSHPYSMDTTMIIAKRCREVANNIGKKEFTDKAVLLEAEAYKGLGYHTQALHLLDSVANHVTDQYRGMMYNYYCALYYSLMENATFEQDAQPYRKKLFAYRDSLISHSSDTITRLVNRIEMLKLQGRYRDAVNLFNRFNQQTNITPNERSVLQHIVAEAYMNCGVTDTAKYYLAQAALGDIRLGIRKYNSLPMLANQLNEDGDVDRAYSYIMCSLYDIQQSKSRTRFLKVFQALPIITQAQHLEEDRTKSYSRIIMVCTSVLALVVIFALIIAYKDNKKISLERARLKEKNDELTKMKENVDLLNQKLTESSRTKEDYIGQLFNLCSEYINIMAHEHNAMYKMLKSGKIQDIEKSLSAAQHSDRLKTFYERFDKVFLDIFPDFIDKFNKLMLPEYQVKIEGKSLTPELRVFALIRLGFTDTNKIAAFLHYSPQTVYNYRFKARNHAAVPKDDFIKSIPLL
jgi:hypothetical protein